MTAYLKQQCAAQMHLRQQRHQAPPPGTLFIAPHPLHARKPRHSSPPPRGSSRSTSAAASAVAVAANAVGVVGAPSVPYSMCWHLRRNYRASVLSGRSFLLACRTSRRVHRLPAILVVFICFFVIFCSAQYFFLTRRHPSEFFLAPPRACYFVCMSVCVWALVRLFACAHATCCCCFHFHFPRCIFTYHSCCCCCFWFWFFLSEIFFSRCAICRKLICRNLQRQQIALNAHSYNNKNNNSS